MRLLDYSVWIPNYCLNDLRSCLQQDRICADVPKLSFLPLMQRRRLSPLGRIVFSTLYPLFRQYADKDSDNCSVIFASRWGDLQLTVNALEELASEKSLSPTHFSTSVHNAIGGLFSMFLNFHGNITSLSGGIDTINAALTEAKSELNQYKTVFVSIYEDQTPDVFKKFQPIPFPFAITLALTQSDNNASSFNWNHDQGESGNFMNNLFDFLDYLQTHKPSDKTIFQG